MLFEFIDDNRLLQIKVTDCNLIFLKLSCRNKFTGIYINLILNVL